MRTEPKRAVTERSEEPESRNADRNAAPFSSSADLGGRRRQTGLLMGNGFGFPSPKTGPSTRREGVSTTNSLQSEECRQHGDIQVLLAL
ncbi:hypothetical protein SKAU_G00119560 [Synaphobranchus kaupii]|uniref:Uncharacterized protein n=1 Tax=Synaphobranchus kaupii TaxID=118154 RepID=A0A9Q1J2D4_SYNKA|nr:hypothetical protein SKAU_G00119560 [Synaphobranchus kaupii]